MQQPTMHHSIISSPHTTDTPQDPLYPVCTVIYKIFDGVQYEGQLHKYYPHRNVYFVSSNSIIPSDSIMSIKPPSLLNLVIY